MDGEFKEKLADLCHKQWSGWMGYLFRKCYNETGQFDKETGNIIIPEWAVNRWKRQMNTEYKDLPEEQKDSDRREAEKFIKLFGE